MPPIDQCYLRHSDLFTERSWHDDIGVKGWETQWIINTGRCGFQLHVYIFAVSRSTPAFVTMNDAFTVSLSRPDYEFPCFALKPFPTFRAKPYPYLRGRLFHLVRFGKV